MILSKFLLFFCFCLLLSHSLAKKLSKAKAEKLFNRALEDGQQYGGELGELGRRYEEMSDQIDDVMRKQNEYNNLIATGLSAKKAKKQLKEAAKQFKKNPTGKNWQRFNIAKEDLENSLGGVARAVAKQSELKRKVAKLATERQTIAVRMIGIIMEEDAEEKRMRQAYKEFQKEERQKKRDERERKREARKQKLEDIKEKKRNDAENKLIETLIGGIAGGGSGVAITTIGGKTIASIVRSRLTRDARRPPPVGEQHPLGDVAL